MSSRESIKDATLSGVRWLTLTRVAMEVLALAAAVALARLVTPAEFGHAAVALIFVQLAVILTFEGFASALVQRPSVEKRDQQAAMLMSLVGGALLSVGLYALSGPAWRPLFGEQTASLIALMSPVLFVAALSGVSRAALWRQLRFRRISMIDLASQFVGNVTSVALAAAALGARAIVLGGLAQTLACTLLLLAAAPPPLPRWSLRSQREIGGFGLPSALAGLVGVLFANVDYAILAARLSATQTGIYYRAFNLGVVYQGKLSGVMMQIAFPLYSRTEDRAELRRLHERAARVHATVIFPLLASLIVLAPVLIPFVFGSAWSASVLPAQILAAAGMMAAVLTGYPQVMLAVGRPWELLRFNLVTLLVYGSAVALAAGHGLVSVAVAVTVVYTGILIGAYRLLLQRHLGIRIRGLVGELAPALSASLALVGASLPVKLLLDGWCPRAVEIGVVGVVGLLVYAAVLAVGFPAAWADLRLLIVKVAPRLGRLGGRSAAPGALPSAAQPATQAD